MQHRPLQTTATRPGRCVVCKNPSRPASRFCSEECYYRGVVIVEQQPKKPALARAKCRRCATKFYFPDPLMRRYGVCASPVYCSEVCFNLRGMATVDWLSLSAEDTQQASEAMARAAEAAATAEADAARRRQEEEQRMAARRRLEDSQKAYGRGGTSKLWAGMKAAQRRRQEAARQVRRARFDREVAQRAAAEQASEAARQAAEWIAEVWREREYIFLLSAGYSPMTCTVCAGSYAVPAATSPGRSKYCSRTCRSRANGAIPHPSKVPQTCVNCGTTRLVHPSYLKRGYTAYCSEACRLTPLRVSVTCRACERPFVMSKRRHDQGEGKFCSWKCRDVFHWAKSMARPVVKPLPIPLYRNCKNCHAVLRVQPRRAADGRGLFCNTTCRREFGMMTLDCSQCGSQFTRKRFLVERTRLLNYCCVACSKSARRSEISETVAASANG